MQLNTLTRTHSLTKARRIGRGGKRGKTSGKGHKGQRSRAGRKIRPAERDIMKRIPKLRGHGKNRARTVNSAPDHTAVVNIRDLVVFTAGAHVDPKTLVAQKIVRRYAGRVPSVKILGMGTLTVAITVSGCLLSTRAKEIIEQAGGTVQS